MKDRIFISDINTESDLPTFTQKELNKQYIKYLIAAECIARKPQNKEEANAILREVESRFNKYTVGASFVEKRKVALLENNFFENVEGNNLKLFRIFAQICNTKV